MEAACYGAYILLGEEAGVTTEEGPVIIGRERNEELTSVQVGLVEPKFRVGMNAPVEEDLEKE